MTHQMIYDEIASYFCEDIDPEKPLLSYCKDSLDIFELTMVLEEKLECENIDLALYKPGTTVKAFADAIMHC